MHAEGQPEIYFESKNVNINSDFSVELSVSGMEDARMIMFEMTFDDSILEYIGFDSALSPDDWMMEASSNIPGYLSFNAFSMADGVSGNALIAKFNFTSINAGASNISFYGNEKYLYNGDGEEISSVWIDGMITVSVPDLTPPTITQVSPIATSTNDTSPSYIFNSDEAGTIAYGGSCTSATVSAVAGDNAITLNTLADGLYSDCTITVTDAGGNASAPLSMNAFTIDATAPVRSNGVPSGELAIGTASANLSVVTGENAVCRYGTSSDMAYIDMTPITSSGSVKHSQTISGLLNGASYDYYVKCSDSLGNVNVDDFIISFSIAADTKAPVIVINGDNPLSIELGSIYTEYGASTTDNVDGEISAVIDNSALNVSAAGTYRVIYSASDSAGNSVSTVRVVNIVDTTAPVRSAGAPTGSQAAGTVSAILSLNTNESAVCAFSVAAGSLYASMTPMIASGTSHTYALAGLANGAEYNYYVKCSDQSGNINADDYGITFSVASPPVSSGGGASSGGSVSSGNGATSGGGVSSGNGASSGGGVSSGNNASSGSSTSSGGGASSGNSVSSSNSVSSGGGGFSVPAGYVIPAVANTNANQDMIRNDKRIEEKTKIVSVLGSSRASKDGGTVIDNGVKTLAGLDAKTVNEISYTEASRVYYHNQRVALSRENVGLYMRITNISPQTLLDQDKYAIAYFIQEGTPTTLILGAGERAGALNSYLSAFNKLPKSEAEWQDVIKIANGRWPEARSASAEKKAQDEHFIKVYKRKADMKNAKDNAAVTIICYGLRLGNRNTESEKAGILIFKNIFKRAPADAIDWDIVRAIAYSGAVR